MSAIDHSPLSGNPALEAMASPARLEILTALGDGPLTTQELAERLGRSRQSLYYHLGVLEQAGLVAAESVPGVERERRFRLVSEYISGRRRSERDQKAGSKAIQALLRLTAREAVAALQDPATRFDGAQRELIGMRGKARLTKAQLRRANDLIDQLIALMTQARSGSSEDALYAVTVVLTPAREAGNAPVRLQEKI